MPFRPFPAIPNRGRHIREYALDDEADYVAGAVLQMDDGEIEEGDENEENILGFSAEPTEFEFGEDFNPGRRLVFVAEANSTFWISMGELDTPDIVATELSEDFIGQTFGLTKHEDTGIWYLDADKDSANQRAVVEDVDFDRNLVEIRILDANRVFN